MDRERLEELCASYVLGALEGDELREFNHLLSQGDADLKHILEEMQWGAMHLPLSAEDATPSSALRERILKAVRPTGHAKARGLTEQVINVLGLHKPGFALALTIVLAFFAAGLGYYATTLNRTVQRQDQRLVELEDELARNRELLSVLQSRRIDVVIMSGLEINPSGYGKIIWDPDQKRAILQISNLPQVPANKDYQLWVIRNKTPISAGVFAVTDEQEEARFFKILDLEVVEKTQIDAFAVTLEPKGGVPQPTGDMYLLGTPTL